MTKDIAKNIDEKTRTEHLGRFSEEELRTLRESKAVEEIRQKEYKTNKQSMGWLALAFAGLLPAHVQQIREAKSVKDYFWGDAETLKDYFNWNNRAEEVKRNFSRLFKGKWNIAGTIAMVVGGVMFAINRSRVNALDEATDIIAKNTLIVNSDEHRKEAPSITEEPEQEHGEKWQSRRKEEKEQVADEGRDR